MCNPRTWSFFRYCTLAAQLSHLGETATDAGWVVSSSVVS